MKLSVERSVLMKALSRVQSVVEKRTTIPILSNVLLGARDQQLALCTTDMDLEIVDLVPASIGETGSTTVPAHTLYDIVRKLPEDVTLALALNESNNTMTISAGRSTYKLGCLPREDFPEMSATKAATSFTLPASTLRNLIDRTRFAMSTEETRYYLNGIYLHAADDAGDKVLRAVATDGHRLARFQVPIPAGAEAMPGVILPRKAVLELRRLLDEAGDDIRIDCSEKMVRFNFEHVTLTTKVIDGTFPDYERVIPQNNDKTLELDPKSFTRAVDRVATVAAEKTRAVKLSIKEKSMTLSANNDNGSAVEEIEAQYSSGSPLEIGFNARYLLDVTQLLDGTNCRFLISDSASPAIVQDNDDPTSLYVLMPMRI
jgi:DNA polymerase III subunit beta